MLNLLKNYFEAFATTLLPYGTQTKYIQPKGALFLPIICGLFKKI
jgi:hypothetical protein